MEEFLSQVRAAAEDMDTDGIEEAFEKLEGYRVPEARKQLYSDIKSAADNFDYDSILTMF